MKVQVGKMKLYPEVFQRKADSERFSWKGTCEVHLFLDHIEIDLNNITYRIGHDGTVTLKPPFRIYSNKKAGIKPKLVYSIVFKETEIWDQIENTIKANLSSDTQNSLERTSTQLEFWSLIKGNCNE